MRILLCALMLSAIGIQEPPPRHDKYRDDPKAYCLPAKPAPDQTSAHECHCAFMCTNPTDGSAATQAESQECEMWCSVTRCACHAEQTCDDREGGQR